MRPTPDELILSIAAFSQGNWTVDEVLELYAYIVMELDELENPPKPTLSVIEGKKHGEQINKE